MCAAPRGNQFWRLRSQHGRDKLFSAPELLWEAATEYFNWIDGHPWYKNELIRSGEKCGEIKKIALARPYTLSGFLLYIRANEAYWRQFKAAKHEGFSTVIDDIEKTMYTQKFEGASVGSFNANIIARDLGLREQTEVMGKGGGPIKTQAEPPPGEIDYTQLTDDVLEAIENARIKPKNESPSGNGS